MSSPPESSIQLGRPFGYVMFALTGLKRTRLGNLFRGFRGHIKTHAG